MKPKKNNKAKQEFPLRLLILSSILGLFLIGGAGLTYAAATLPESFFVKRLSVHHASLKEFSSFDEAINFLNEWEQNAFSQATITWTSPEKPNVVTSFGLLAKESNIEELESYLDGFMENENLLNKMRVLVFGENLNYELILSPEIRAPFLGAGIEQGMKEASYIYVKDHVAVDPEQVGIGIETSVVRARIEYAWSESSKEIPAVFADQEVPLRSSLPIYRKEDLEAHLAEAELLAARTLLLKTDLSGASEIVMKDHMDCVVPAEEGWDIWDAKFLNHVQSNVSPNVESEAASAVIKEEDGRYTFEGSARFGNDLDEDKLLKEFEAAVNSDQNEIALQITEVQPELTIPDSLKAKGVTELLGFGYSSFSGSPTNRIYNVNRGMNQFSGTLIEPGAEFSFTTLMGPIDAENGWLPELVIKGDETIPEYGGGLCQVSSTMFRAALYTGLPITARKNHSYAVRYYAVPFGYGLDATVYDPAPDLRFVNNTPGAILVQGYTEGTDAYFVFYGTNDGRSVKMEGPFDYNYNSVSEPAIIYTDNLEAGERELKEYAHVGFDVDWYRTIYDATGNVIGDRETIHSSYEARPPKYFEGKAPEISSEPSS